MKNKLTIKIFLFFILFIANMSICHAIVYRAHLNNNSVYLRSGPGTNYSSLKTLSKDSEYTMVNDTLYPDEKGCSKGWYKIYYEASATGYVCSEYITVTKLAFSEEASNECEQNLKDAGFPSSYWPGLCSLKEKHPTWDFSPIFTGLDWSSAVENESACGKSYISSSIPTNIDSTCKNEYTKTWYPASSSAVAYYMDPRNWFSENTIFQFEYLRYSDTLKDKYMDAANGIIANTEFYKYHLGIGNNLGEIINSSGITANISPIFISSRILQELGNGTSLYNLYCGVYKENEGKYLGYYNFYNFGVTDSCATSKGTTICGLDYAISKGWNSVYNAIYGGASQIASSYIAVGQYNGYLQKYNVVPTDSSKLYSHQYMTNIAAPSSEAKTTYNSYKGLGVIDSPFVFYIPVYNNMDDSFYQEGNGAVDSPDNNETSSLDISTIVVSSGYKYTSGQISGIKSKSEVKLVKSNLESIAGAGNVLIKNSKDVLVTDGYIGTGFKITINNSEKSETLTVVIIGDTSGDGLINALDLLQVQKSILGTYSLNSVYQIAGDTSGDGKVNALDLLQIQKSILGTYTIE